MTALHKILTAACVLIAGLFLVAQNAESQQRPFEQQIVGNWKYGPPTQKDKPAVEPAKGYVTITDMKRWIFLGNDEGGKVGAWTSYSGPFVVDGDKVTITVDVATDPAMVGKVITRYLAVLGKELKIMTSRGGPAAGVLPSAVHSARPC